MNIISLNYTDLRFKTAAILAAVAEAVTKKQFSELFEEFIQKELGLVNTTVEEEPEGCTPLAAKGKKILPFWVWKRDNPYIAGV